MQQNGGRTHDRPASIPMPAATGALALDTYELTKRFGSFTAMDRVTMHVEPGTVHALLGENGAGKSTLVKCVAGFQRAEEGSILIDGREQDIANPIVARALGIGMVYQHFTLAPGHDGGREPAAGRRQDAGADRLEDASAPSSKDFLATTPFTPRPRRARRRSWRPARSRSSNCSSSST